MLKLIIIGDSGVGKTCILLNYVGDSFQAPHISTIGKYDFLWISQNFYWKNILWEHEKIIWVMGWPPGHQRSFSSNSSQALSPHSFPLFIKFLKHFKQKCGNMNDYRQSFFELNYLAGGAIFMIGSWSHITYSGWEFIKELSVQEWPDWWTLLKYAWCCILYFNFSMIILTKLLKKMELRGKHIK